MSAEYGSIFFLIDLKRYQIKTHYLISEEKSVLVICIFFFPISVTMVKSSKSF